MANARKHTVTREIVTPVEEEVVTLELKPIEADFLKDILGLVGGNPLYTARKYADAIRAALLLADDTHRVFRKEKGMLDCIYFAIEENLP